LPLTGFRVSSGKMNRRAAVERIKVVQGDITLFHGDAIVNAANESLLGGGGVDGAIHRAAGPELLAECRALHGCLTGNAVLTKGYDLPARHVIHTVGPVWQGGHHMEERLLASCYRSSLDIAEREGLARVAFPAISTGAYGYPLEVATRVAVSTIVDWLVTHAMPEEVTCMCFDTATLDVYGSVLAQIAAEAVGEAAC
jgi:O-acetyl-ADP-ribose deacetylase (regulator of RNase III)